MRMKALLGGAGFAALLLLGSPLAQAQPWGGGGDCRDRIEHAQRHLDRVIDRFGPHSDMAREARDELERVRSWCWRHEHDRWHDHDWHDHDHWH